MKDKQNDEMHPLYQEGVPVFRSRKCCDAIYELNKVKCSTKLIRYKQIIANLLFHDL